MEQYIPKSIVVAEIERLMTPECSYSMNKLLDYINSLEVKGVDIKTELGKYFGACYHNKDYNIAKHFFELGVNTSNPLTLEDIANINNIISKILKECDDNILYDTEEDFCKEVLKRFKTLKEDI